MKKEAESLISEFAVILDVLPKQIAGLKLCRACGGIDYQWTDWGGTVLYPADLPLENGDTRAYRQSLTDSMCQACEGTGFEGGSLSLEKEDWIKLGQIKK